MVKNKVNTIGGWAFLIGVVLAIILGLLPNGINQTWTYVLVIAGLIVGLLNIADKETTPFLMSGIVLIIASTFGQVVMDGVPVFNGMLKTLLIIFVPATIIVAIKNAFSLARS